MRPVVCSVCKKMYKSALTDVYGLFDTIYIFSQISQQDVFNIMIYFQHRFPFFCLLART